jgi:hypothetical protein
MRHFKAARLFHGRDSHLRAIHPTKLLIFYTALAKEYNVLRKNWATSFGTYNGDDGALRIDSDFYIFRSLLVYVLRLEAHIFLNTNKSRPSKSSDGDFSVHWLQSTHVCKVNDHSSKCR